MSVLQIKETAQLLQQNFLLNSYLTPWLMEKNKAASSLLRWASSVVKKERLPLLVLLLNYFHKWLGKEQTDYYNALSASSHSAD